MVDKVVLIRVVFNKARSAFIKNSIHFYLYFDLNVLRLINSDIFFEYSSERTLISVKKIKIFF